MEEQGYVEKRHVRLADEIERVGAIVVDAAIAVHRRLGPGLLEKVYEICLAHELKRRGLRVERQVPVAILYDDLRVEGAFEIDLLVEGCVIVETKSKEAILPIHAHQTLTHLRLTGLRLGFLINFNVVLLRDGIKRLVN